MGSPRFVQHRLQQVSNSPAQAWPCWPRYSRCPAVLGVGTDRALQGGEGGDDGPLAPLPFQWAHALVCARLRGRFTDIRWVDRWTNHRLPKSQVLLELPTMQDLSEAWLRAELWSQHHGTHRTHSAYRSLSWDGPSLWPGRCSEASQTGSK